MTAAESRFPWWRVADGEQCDVELAVRTPQDAFDEVVGRGRQRRVAGKERALVRRFEEIHVRRAEPPIEAIPVAPMLCPCRVNSQRAVTKGDDAARVEARGISISLAQEPPGDGRRREQRYFARKLIERPKREVVGVRVSQQHGIERRQRIDGKAGRGDSRQEPAERRVEVGVREDPATFDLEQQRGVTDVRDSHESVASAQGAPCCGAAGPPCGTSAYAVRPFRSPAAGGGGSLVLVPAGKHCCGCAAAFCASVYKFYSPAKLRKTIGKSTAIM